MADGIDKLRREIDALDDELLALVNKRATLAQKIGALKGGAPSAGANLTSCQVREAH